MKMEEEVEAEDEEEIEEADQKKYKFNFTWYQLIRSENFLIMGLGKFTKTYLDEIRTDEKK